jgi:hypothetical protein
MIRGPEGLQLLRSCAKAGACPADLQIRRRALYISGH